MLTRLVGYFLLLSLIPLVILTGMSRQRSVDTLKQETFERLTAVAVLKEDAINRWVAGMKRNTRLLAQAPIVREYAGSLLTREETDPQFLSAYEILQNHFTTILAEEPDFLEILLLTDVGGQVRLSTNREHEGEYKVTDTYFVRGREETYVQNVYPSVSLGQPAMTIATPLFDDSGTRVGVLAVHLNLNVLGEILLEKTGLGATGETYLVDQLNVFVSEAKFGPERFPRGVHTEGIDAALGGMDGTGLYENYRGVPVVGAYRWMEERELALLAEVEQEEALAPARELTRTFVLVGLIMVGLVVAAAYGTARQISAPIIALTETATRITAGDLEQEVTVRTRDEIGTLAQAFNSMTAQLRELIGSLEQRVAERTHDLARRSAELEASAQVAREAAAIRDVKQLLDATVRLISEQFGFYHAGIFLLDEAKTYAILAAASSEGGQRMLARGHRLEVGQVGIVGYVSAQGEPRVALDVGQDAYFFNNPDLPETRSEAGLPLQVHGQVIGVLDVQSERAAAFSAEDVEILQTLADQLALAIDNAHLLEESRQALQELQTLYGQQTRSAWRERLAGKPEGYFLSGGQVTPLEQEPPLPAGTLQASTQQAELQAEGRRIVAPVSLRGQNVGSLVFWREEGQEPWSSEDVEMLESLSVQVGLALENARLLEDSRRRAEREQLVGQMTAQFTRSLDMDAVLRTAVRELGQLPQVAEVSVHVVPPEASPAASEREEA